MVLLAREESGSTQELNGDIVDFSTSGLAVIAKDSLALGAVTRLTLVDVPPFKEKIALGTGEVISVTPARCGKAGCSRIGLKFLEADQQAIGKVFQALHAQIHHQARRTTSASNARANAGRSWF